MKKLLPLLFLIPIACKKENPLLPLPSKTEIVAPQQPEATTSPTDPAIIRKETLFNRLANSCLRGEEDVEVGDLHIGFDAVNGAPAEYETLYLEFTKRNPFFFHLITDGSLGVFYKMDNPSEVRKYQFGYSINIQELEAWVQKVDPALEEYYSCLREGMSEAEIAYTLYQKITEKTTYRESLNAANALGALVEGKAVCQGYSLTYCLLMESLGFRVEFIRGAIPGSSGHMWNRINLDGEWYNADATWDDNERNKVEASCTGTYFLSSDQLFYEQQGHPKAFQIPSIPVATSTLFDSSAYFFRNNQNQTNAAYVEGFWYYLSLNEMCIYKSRFDGSEKQLIHQLNHSASVSFLWKQIAFGAERIYFIDQVAGQNFRCSITYSGEGFEKGNPITFSELRDPSLKPTNDIPVRRHFGMVALRTEVVLCKFKDAYFHGEEDFSLPENPKRLLFVKTIREAEAFLQGKVKDEAAAERLYRRLHEQRKQHDMPMTKKLNNRGLLNNEKSLSKNQTGSFFS